MVDELALASFEAGYHAVCRTRVPGDCPGASISASVRAMSVSTDRAFAPEAPDNVSGGGGNGVDVLGQATAKETISEQGEPGNSVTLVTFGLSRSQVAKDSARFNAVTFFLHHRKLWRRVWFVIGSNTGDPSAKYLRFTRVEGRKRIAHSGSPYRNRKGKEEVEGRSILLNANAEANTLAGKQFFFFPHGARRLI